MADRWMDERDREWRDRDWRRSEEATRNFGRGGVPRGGEDRSWAGSADDDRGPYDAGRYDTGGYESSGRGGRDYGGERDYRGGAELTSGGAYGGGSRPAFAQRAPDYTGRGGDSYRDYDFERRSGHGRGEADLYRRETQGAHAPRYDDDEARRRAWASDGDRSYNREIDQRYEPQMRHRPSGGTGGYDYERGYGDAGRSERPGREPWEDRRDDNRGGGADFLSKAGERISSWFRGDHLMRGSRDDEGDGPRRYREDFGRESRPIPDRGARGLGPRGYKRADERISDEVHDRLTDDPWLDASNIQVEVKGGEVTLNGTVDNREGKHRAERLIEDLSGVTHVQNNLRVVSDASLTGAGRGLGSNVLEAEMRRENLETDPGNRGVSGASGRTSTGAAAERSGPASD